LQVKLETEFSGSSWGVAEMGNMNSMLRIITQVSEAEAELQRINDQYLNPTQVEYAANTIRKILTDVLVRGDQALLESISSFSVKLQVSGSELDAAYQQVNQELLKAIRETCENLSKFYQHKIPKSWVHFAEEQTIIGKRYTPLKRVGIYIPAKTTRALMVLLLYSVCATVAKVEQKVLILSPTMEEEVLPGLLVAAQETGITEIYRLSEVQAIGALAYGTATIPKVDLILAQGDLNITLAKQIVTGRVKVESFVNHGSLLIFADPKADPIVLAKDLLAQAEENSAAILLTKSLKIARSVQEEIAKQLEAEPLKNIQLEKAIAHSGLIIVVESLTMAIELINNFAPQALQLAVKDPWSLINSINNAGTIFMGYTTPQVVGNYFGGSAINLLGPGISRYASALSVETFLKQINVIEYSPSGLKRLKPTLQILAQTEGLTKAIDTIEVRLKDELI